MCGRLLLVTVPSGPLRKTDEFVGHVRHYTVDMLTGLLAGAGFRTLDCFAWGAPFHSLYRWALDLSPERIMRSYGKERYGWKERWICGLLYRLFFLNSYRHGCQLFYLGEVSRPGSGPEGVA
jgi:hypothetical protein